MSRDTADWLGFAARVLVAEIVIIGTALLGLLGLVQWAVGA